MAVRKQTFPNLPQVLADNAAFRRMSEAQRASIVQQVNQLPLQVAQVFMNLLEAKRARRAAKSAASKARKGQRQAFGLQAGVAAAGGALTGGVLGGMGALGSAFGAGTGALLGVGTALGGTGLTGAIGLPVRKTSDFRGFGGFDPLSAPAVPLPAIGTGQSFFEPAAISAGVPINVPGGRFPAESFSPPGQAIFPKDPQFPSLQKALPPSVLRDPVSSRAFNLRQLGKKAFAAGDMEGAQQLAELLAELETA